MHLHKSFTFLGRRFCYTSSCHYETTTGEGYDRRKNRYDRGGSTNDKTKSGGNSRPMDPYLSTDRALSKGRAAAYLAGGMGGKDAVSPEERKQNMNMARAVAAGVMAAENYVGSAEIRRHRRG